MLRAFRHRNYRLFFLGQGISVTGTWMQQIAIGWLVYRTTHSALLLGVVGFSGQIPGLLLTAFAGVLVDRWPCRRILLVTQTLAMAQATILAVLALSHHIAIWQIVVLAAFLGTVNALDMPTRQAFVIEMVEDKADLPSGIALNSSVFNAARLVGPSIAGVIVALWGEGVCFLLNAISYLAVLAALLAMRVPNRPHAVAHPPFVEGLRDGIRYVLECKPIKAVLVLLAVFNIVGMPYAVLIPVFAGKVLHGGSHTYGFLVAASAAGSLTGAAFLASRRTALGLERLVTIGLTVFALSILGFSASEFLWLSMPLLVLSGFGGMVVFASCNTLVQTIVEDSKRGRVMSLYTLSFMGVAPFGTLLAGALARSIEAPPTVALYGVACLGATALYALRLPSLTAALGRLHAPPETVVEAPQPYESSAGGGQG